MLANLGWAPGKGLGINEDGRAVPVEVGKVLRGQGIQKGIRTEDSKREARRKGETISDEEDKPMRRGKKAHGGSQRIPKSEAEQGWKRQKKVKVKVEHKTYEQLLAEAGDAAAPGVGLVLDARGGEVSAPMEQILIRDSSKRCSPCLTCP
jgi:tuftelin-interacting protein 11